MRTAPLPTVLVLITVLLCNCYFVCGNSAANKLFVILVDGCRWDYMERDIENLPGFKMLMDYGVRAPYLTPIFPANSYPNWYTLMTGLYAESHGFVQNMLYDAVHGDFFLMGPNETADTPHWWGDAEPLWVTAEKHGLRTALYWWDGCQVEIRGRKPTFCRKYKYVGHWPTVQEDTRAAIMTSLQQLQNDEVQIVQLYYEPVDHVGHKFGPDSDESRRVVRDFDDILLMTQREMAKMGLSDEVNLVVFSDHGMTSTAELSVSIINLEKLIDVNDIKYMVYYGASSMLLPEEGKIDKVYNALRGVKGLNVYLKEDIPEHYHVKNNRLTLPILLVASPNFYIKGLDYPGKSIPTGSSVPLGSHGYDPYAVPDMRGIFLARGPGLRKNYISPPMQNTDIYNILCDLLDILPLPNNGTKSLTNSLIALPLSSSNTLPGPSLQRVTVVSLAVYFLHMYRFLFT